MTLDVLEGVLIYLVDCKYYLCSLKLRSTINLFLHWFHVFSHISFLISNQREIASRSSFEIANLFSVCSQAFKIVDTSIDQSTAYFQKNSFINFIWFEQRKSQTRCRRRWFWKTKIILLHNEVLLQCRAILTRLNFNQNNTNLYVNGDHHERWNKNRMYFNSFSMLHCKCEKELVFILINDYHKSLMLVISMFFVVIRTKAFTERRKSTKIVVKKLFVYRKDQWLPSKIY